MKQMKNKLKPLYTQWLKRMLGYGFDQELTIDVVKDIYIQNLTKLTYIAKITENIEENYLDYVGVDGLKELIAALKDLKQFNENECKKLGIDLDVIKEGGLYV